MSGGRFYYKQYEIGYIANDIESVIEKNGRKKTDEELKQEWVNSPDWYKNKRYPYPEELYHCKYPDEVIEKFKEAVKILRMAEIYAHRIDLLLSGDDAVDTFLKSFKKDLENS